MAVTADKAATKQLLNSYAGHDMERSPDLAFSNPQRTRRSDQQVAEAVPHAGHCFKRGRAARLPSSSLPIAKASPFLLGRRGER